MVSDAAVYGAAKEKAEEVDDERDDVKRGRKKGEQADIAAFMPMQR